MLQLYKSRLCIISACCTMKMITKTRKALERDSLKMIGRLGMETDQGGLQLILNYILITL